LNAIIFYLCILKDNDITWFDLANLILQSGLILQTLRFKIGVKDAVT